MTLEERKKKFLEEYKTLAYSHGLDMAPMLDITELGIKPVITVIELPEGMTKNAQ